MLLRMMVMYPHDDNKELEEGNQQHSQEIYDYRKTPYMNPVLDVEQAQLVAEQLRLMTRKGVYPYEYMDSWKKINEINLAPKDMLYNIHSVRRQT